MKIDLLAKSEFDEGWSENKNYNNCTIGKVSMFSYFLKQSYLSYMVTPEKGERTEETNASTLVRVTSHVTIAPKAHCEQTKK